MDESSLEPQTTRLKGRQVRDIGIGVKVTSTEFEAVLASAKAAQMTPAEYARDVLLRAARQAPPSAILPELKGMQALLLNSLRTLLCGQKLMTPEQFSQIVEHAKAVRNDAAKEVA